MHHKMVETVCACAFLGWRKPASCLELCLRNYNSWNRDLPLRLTLGGWASSIAALYVVFENIMFLVRTLKILALSNSCFFKIGYAVLSKLFNSLPLRVSI